MRLDKKELKKKYAFGVYKPNANSVKIVYKGKTYLSKKQCMVLNDLTVKQLKEYLDAQ